MRFLTSIKAKIFAYFAGWSILLVILGVTLLQLAAARNGVIAGVAVGLPIFMLLYALWGWTYFLRSISQPLVSLLEVVGQENPEIESAARGKGEFVALWHAYEGLIERLATSVHKQHDANVQMERQSHILAGLNADLGRTASFLQAVLNSTTDAIITFNESGFIESANPAAEHIFRRPNGALVQQSVFSLMAESYREPYERDLQRYVDGEEPRPGKKLRELEGLRHDGTVFPVEIAVNEFHLGDRRLFVAAVRDISERKVVERMKREFVSTVSHELRAPLTSIAGSLGLLEGNAVGTLSEKAQRLISIAHSNCRRLVRLINDILDLDKMDMGKMAFSFAPVSARQVVFASIDATRGYADDLGVQLQVETDCSDVFIHGDADRVTQVMVNLISNACKFSPIGGTVEVGANPSGQNVRMFVRDHGPGIPAEFRNNVFEQFAQADSSDRRRQGGTGLGLNIAKSIVDHHNGRIWFDSSPEHGTTFYVELPTVHFLSDDARTT